VSDAKSLSIDKPNDPSFKSISEKSNVESISIDITIEEDDGKQPEHDFKKVNMLNFWLQSFGVLN